MKHVLLLTIQPPPTQGVQGIRYAKLYSALKSSGVQLHFAGPNPDIASVRSLPSSVIEKDQDSFYFDRVGCERRVAVMRQRSKGVRAWSWFLLLAIVKLLRISKLARPYSYFVKRGLNEVVDTALRRREFDCIAGVAPVYPVLVEGFTKARQYGLPFVAIYHDPIGHRENGRLIPHNQQEQDCILRGSKGIIFASRRTKESYCNVFPYIAGKAKVITDSYPSLSYDTKAASDIPRLLHLGNLSEWRPIEPLFSAMLKLSGLHQGEDILQMEQVGGLYPAARSQHQRSKTLQSMITISEEVDYLDSHRLASNCDWILVVVGPQHYDNIPSKLFEYLAHEKPILLLAPTKSEAWETVKNNSWGLVADCADEQDILRCLKTIVNTHAQYSVIQSECAKNRSAFESHKVAKLFAEHIKFFLSSKE